MTTTYIYHVRVDPSISANKENPVAMIAALEEFYPDHLEVFDCIELRTPRSDIATVLENLFGVQPELRCDDGQALAEGDRVHHIRNGWYEVYRMDDGALGVRRVRS